MNPHRNWPYLQLLAGELYHIDPTFDYSDQDSARMDTQEAHIQEWIKKLVRSDEKDDLKALRSRFVVVHIDRGLEKPDASGRQPHSFVYYIFEMAKVLVEEGWGYPLPKDWPNSPSPPLMQKFNEVPYAECPDDVKEKCSDIFAIMGKDN